MTPTTEKPQASSSLSSKEWNPALKALVILALAALIIFLLRSVLPSVWPWCWLLVLNPKALAFLIFVFGAALLLWGTRLWLSRIDSHPLLNPGEKLQNKDALVIASYAAIAMLFGLCITGAAVVEVVHNGTPGPIFLAILWALAATAAGGGFGFLFGLPRRTGEDAAGKPTTPTLFKTGLDDIIDWLVKGITAVALVESKTVLTKLPGVADRLANGLVQGAVTGTAPSDASALALAIIVLFASLGFFGTYLVTRTYLTGALTRADRTTMGAFQAVGLSFSEGILLLESERDLSSKGRGLSCSAQRAADKLAQLPLDQLNTPQELAMWAKAKSALGKPKEAFEGYEKALSLSKCDPALLLDYAVALDEGGEPKLKVLRFMQEAYRHLSDATPPRVRKNVYKSLSYAHLYQPPPDGFEKALKYIQEYRALNDRLPSGAILVNEACAWAQMFRWEAERSQLIKPKDGEVITLPDEDDWTDQMKTARENALRAMKEAIARDPDWAGQFRLLLQSRHPDKIKNDKLKLENDFEVFETLEDFRLALHPLETALPQGPPQENAGGEDTSEDDTK